MYMSIRRLSPVDGSNVNGVIGIMKSIVSVPKRVADSVPVKTCVNGVVSLFTKVVLRESGLAVVGASDRLKVSSIVPLSVRPGMEPTADAKPMLVIVIGPVVNRLFA